MFSISAVTTLQNIVLHVQGLVKKVSFFQSTLSMSVGMYRGAAVSRFSSQWVSQSLFAGCPCFWRKTVRDKYTVGLQVVNLSCQLVNFCLYSKNIIQCRIWSMDGVNWILLFLSAWSTKINNKWMCRILNQKARWTFTLSKRAVTKSLEHANIVEERNLCMHSCTAIT